jgi:transposase-like protein
MARYGQAFKDRAVARLLLPESAAVEVVAREVGIGAGTLERWREDAQSRPARGRAWTAGARLEAVITTAAMNEAARSAWCREHGVYPTELDKWRASCTTALADPEDARASPQATRADRKRIQGTRARPAAQGPRSGRDGGAAGAHKKSCGDLHKGEDE